MYGAIIKKPEFDEEYVSLQHIAEPEENRYYDIACYVLVITSIYGIVFFLLFYAL